MTASVDGGSSFYSSNDSQVSLDIMTPKKGTVTYSQAQLNHDSNTNYRINRDNLVQREYNHALTLPSINANTSHSNNGPATTSSKIRDRVLGIASVKSPRSLVPDLLQHHLTTNVDASQIVPPEVDSAMAQLVKVRVRREELIEFVRQCLRQCHQGPFTKGRSMHGHTRSLSDCIHDCADVLSDFEHRESDRYQLAAELASYPQTYHVLIDLMKNSGKKTAVEYSVSKIDEMIKSIEDQDESHVTAVLGSNDEGSYEGLVYEDLDELSVGHD